MAKKLCQIDAKDEDDDWHVEVWFSVVDDIRDLRDAMEFRKNGKCPNEIIIICVRSSDRPKEFRPKGQI